MNAATSIPCKTVIVGAGPAGLMAAEILAEAGHRVEVYDAMPSAGRKFLLAGLGGLNLTHAEPFAAFVTRYGVRRDVFETILAQFGAQQLRDWAHALGIPTFIGSSERVFPEGMKAAPLLRAWLQRLRERGVRFHAKHRWLGWSDQHSPGCDPTRGLRFSTPDGECIVDVDADAVILALGGASWPKLGSDGAWVPLLEARGIGVSSLKPANCGFEVASPRNATANTTGWSEYLSAGFAGQPLKNIAIRFTDAQGIEYRRKGECVLTRYGLEGSLIYALSAALRDTISAVGDVTLYIDLLPERDENQIRDELAKPRGSRSFSSHLRSKTGIGGVKAALLHECAPAESLHDAIRLAALLKALPLTLHSPRPIDEAISSAGGVMFEELDERLMLRELPGVFCCGEMLDWEAPTGGYLLTGCFSTGHAAGQGAAAWLQRRNS